MNKNQEYGLLGYLLADPNRYLYDVPDRLYFGIDREPYFIAPNPLIREEMGIPLETNKKKVELLTKWFDNSFRRGSFFDSYEAAVSLQKNFLDVGEALDLIVCEIWLEGLMKPLPIELLPPTQPPSGYIIYGFDVSWPTGSFDSRLRQPSFLSDEPSWIKKLNEYGLLSNLEDAKAFRNAYLKYRPDRNDYEVLRIWGNRVGSTRDHPDFP
jgi:hypothetical protein